MVDVSAKPVTQRQAVASATLKVRPQVLDAILAGQMPKGDVLAVARVAGIQAAKRTADLIPLCHPLPLDRVTVEFTRGATDRLRIEASAQATARTGVEMEALTAVSVATLTVYDMCKSADRAMVIGPIRLESKRGGRSGEYRADTPPA